MLSINLQKCLYSRLFWGNLHIIKWLIRAVRIGITILLFMTCLNISIAQTTHDIKLSVGVNPKFTLDEGYNFHISWGSAKDAIWYGVLNSSGHIIKEFKFPDTEGCCGESNIAFRNNNVAVVWRYLTQSYNSYIIGQIFSASQDSASKVNINFYDPFFDAQRFEPTVDFINDSTLIVAWYGEGPQTQAGQRGIYGEITTVSLSTLGNNFLINDFLDNNTTAALQKILIGKDEKTFLAIWHDDRSGTDEVYGRLFDITGTSKGKSFLISEIPENAYMFYFSGATDKKDGNYVVVWAVESSPYWQLRWRWINKDGIPLGPSEPLTSEKEPVKGLASVDIDIDDEGKIIVVWEQEHNGYSTIFGRRFYDSSVPYGGVFKVSESEYASDQYSPIVKIKNNKIFAMWTNSTQYTWDGIYTRVIDFFDTTLVGIEENTNITKDDFNLGQNYPNPFNAITTINYSIPNSINKSFVQLKVFDILGREVTTLVNEGQAPGTYQVHFNSEKILGCKNVLSSGLYLYQLRYGNLIQTRKMLLVK